MTSCSPHLRGRPKAFVPVLYSKISNKVNFSFDQTHRGGGGELEDYN